jgi:hypothetical protein
MSTIEEEWRARAIRAHRAFESAMRDVTGDTRTFDALSDDEKRAWDSAAAAAHAYRPEGARESTARYANVLGMLNTAYVALGAAIEALSPPAE